MTTKARDGLEVEHSADPLDRAAREADAATQDAIREHSRRAAADMPRPALDGLCVDCEDPVEQGRIDCGLGRCLACQQLKERTEALRNKMRGIR